MIPKKTDLIAQLLKFKKDQLNRTLFIDCLAS